MSIVEIQGDLLTSDCDVIAHSCNCFHTMGSGIARAIRKKYPEAYSIDKSQTKCGDTSKLGSFTKAELSNITVYNLYTQWNYGKQAGKVYVQYDKAERALNAMKQDLITNNKYETSKIGMPHISCNLAGGNWNIMKQIIEKVFDDKEVYVYSL